MEADQPTALDDGGANQPQPGCSCINMLAPVFVIAGAVIGFKLVAPFGIGWAVLGAVAGFVLGVPALGVFVAIALGFAYVWDRIFAPKDPSRTGES